jgi:hypothetical protein
MTALVTAIALLMTATGVLATAVLGFMNFFLNMKTHDLVNSMSDKRNAATAKSSFAEGVKSEVERSRGDRL